jgi:hypothetical protein
MAVSQGTRTNPIAVILVPWMVLDNQWSEALRRRVGASAAAATRTRKRALSVPSKRETGF